MVEIVLPGRDLVRLEYLVADFNGTLAMDGALRPGVADALRAIASRLTIHVITADTFGSARDALTGLPVEVVVLSPPGPHDVAKQAHVAHLGAGRCVAIGNGRNDCLMLKAAALGIVVIEGEGTAVATLLAADVAASGITTALDLLLHPTRLVATLRH